MTSGFFCKPRRRAPFQVIADTAWTVDASSLRDHAAGGDHAAAMRAVATMTVATCFTRRRCRWRSSPTATAHHPRCLPVNYLSGSHLAPRHLAAVHNGASDCTICRRGHTMTSVSCDATPAVLRLETFRDPNFGPGLSRGLKPNISAHSQRQSSSLVFDPEPDLQYILRQPYDFPTPPKLRSTYDACLTYQTSYEGRKAFLRYDSLAKSYDRLRQCS